MDDSAYVRHLAKGQIIENAIRAEREGFDGFSISNTMEIDLGYLEVRNVVHLPVSFLSESSLHLACVLANKFSVICWNRPLKEIAERTIRQYGLTESYIPCDYFEVSEEQALSGFDDPDFILGMVRKTATKAIQQGARILVPFCNIMNVLLHNSGLKEIEGVPVFNTSVMIIKWIEFLVELDRIGIGRSPSGLHSSLTSEDLSSVRRAFQLE